MHKDSKTVHVILFPAKTGQQRQKMKKDKEYDTLLKEHKQKDKKGKWTEANQSSFKKWIRSNTF
jgi:hypothetical protein